MVKSAQTGRPFGIKIALVLLASVVGVITVAEPGPGGASAQPAAATTSVLGSEPSHQGLFESSLSCPNNCQEGVAILPDGRALLHGSGYRGTAGSGDFAIFKPGSTEPPALDSSPCAVCPKEGATMTLLGNGKVLLTGGTQVETSFLAANVPTQASVIYDPANGASRQTAPMLTARMYHSASLLPSGRVLVAGGCSSLTCSNPFNPTPASEIFDPTTETWTPTGDMKGEVDVKGEVHGRVFYTLTLIDPKVGVCLERPSPSSCGKVLAAGGDADPGGQKATDSAELFDENAVDPSNPAVKGAWTKVPSTMTSKRRFHAATQLGDGSVLIEGGRGDDGDYYGSTGVNTADIYEPAAAGTGKFAPTLNPMSIARSGQTSTLLQNGRILVAGGSCWTNSDPAEITDFCPKAELYDPQIKDWRKAADMSTGVGDNQVGGTGPQARAVALPSGPVGKCKTNCGKVLIAGPTNGSMPASVPANGSNYVMELYTPRPMVTPLLAATGPLKGGTAVVLVGSGLTGAAFHPDNCTTCGVFFGGVRASLAEPDPSDPRAPDTRLTAVSPPHPSAGVTVPITVTTPAGADVPAGQFTYEDLPVPSLSGIIPDCGPLSGGTAVTLSGLNLTGATSVAFGSAADTANVVPSSRFASASGVSISFASPPHAEGTVDVTVNGPGGASLPAAAARFAYPCASATRFGGGGDADPGGGASTTSQSTGAKPPPAGVSAHSGAAGTAGSGHIPAPPGSAPVGGPASGAAPVSAQVANPVALNSPVGAQALAQIPVQAPVLAPQAVTAPNAGITIGPSRSSEVAPQYSMVGHSESRGALVLAASGMLALFGCALLGRRRPLAEPEAIPCFATAYSAGGG